MPKSEIAGSCDSYFFSFLRNPHPVPHRDCINLPSLQQCRKVPFCPHPLHRLLFVDLLMMVIVTGVRWYLVVILICISLIVMLSIFSCAFWPSICVLWRNVCLGLLPIFRLGCLLLLLFLSIYWAVHIFWKLMPCQSHHLQCFLPFCRLFFHFVYGFLWCTKTYKLN